MAKGKQTLSKLSALNLDEVSVVDRGANQHAEIVLAKRAPEADDYFPVEKKGESKGAAPGTESASGSDPAEVTKDPNGEDGDIGPDKVIGGTQKIKGEDTPPKKAKTKGASTGDGDINPSPLKGVGKKDDGFWTDLAKSILSESTPDYSEVGKFGGMNPMQQPQMSPHPGMMGANQPPMMQTPGVQPMGAGQPGLPGAQPGMPGQQGGMAAQLPPEVVQYIQQLEAALDQLLGDKGDGGGEPDPQKQANSEPSKDSGSGSSEKKNPFGKSEEYNMSTSEDFLVELAKSLDAEDQREAVSKAIEEVRKAAARADAAEEIAKQERDLRLNREFVAKAEQYCLPVKATELGPVLKRLAETISQEDFSVITKCLDAASASNDLFGEIGKRGGGANDSITNEVEMRAQEIIAKSKSDLSTEEAFAKALEMDPHAYDRYLADRRSR